MCRNSLFSAVLLLSIGLGYSGQTAEPKTTDATRIVVYYCHSAFRCASCLALEDLTREAILGTAAVPGPLAAEVEAGRIALRVVDLDAPENGALSKRLGVEPKTVLIAEEVGDGVLRKSVLEKVWFLLDDRSECLKHIRNAVQAFVRGEAPEQIAADASESIISAQEGYQRSLLPNERERMHIVDVRTPAEHGFVGHPEGARNVPFLLMTYAYNAELKKQGMRKNPRFIEQIRRHYSPDDRLAFLCRSGPRGAMAVRVLAQNGYKHLYVIRHGFEGEREGRAGHSDYGKRVINGWRNEGVPWTTSLAPELMYTDDRLSANQDSRTTDTANQPECWSVPEWLRDVPFSPVFQVRDTEHKYGRYDPTAKSVTLEDLIRFHGHFCGGLVESAGALKLALDALFSDGIIDRTDLEVATKNSACGVDVATYLTGTRVRYGSCRLGKTFNPSEFIVRRVSSGTTVRVRVRDEVVPVEVRKQMRRIQAGYNTPEDIDRFRDLQWAYARRLVSRPLGESYVVAMLDDYTMPEAVTTAWGTRGDNAYKDTPRTGPNTLNGTEQKED